MKEYNLNKQKQVKTFISVLMGLVFLSINFIQQISYFKEHPYYFIGMYFILFLILIIIANIYKIFEWKPFLIYLLIGIILISIRLYMIYSSN
jgi:energy-coupling factor transporter transmembrane protein EcfT